VKIDRRLATTVQNREPYRHRRRRGASARAAEVVPDALLAHTTPLSCEHIGLSRGFLQDRAAAAAEKKRPLNRGPPQDPA
jgi:hypothetical protein